MTKWLWLALLLLFISACAAPQVPEYVVVVSSPNGGICTGVMLDEHRVRVANHCLTRFKMDWVFAQDGQNSPFVIESRSVETDQALLRLVKPVYLARYATFSAPDYHRTAFAFGACPRFSLSVARPVIAMTQYEFENRSYCEVWLSFIPICGGDSGGPLIQDGNVVGMIHSVDRLDSSGSAYGNYVCIGQVQ